MKWSLPSYDFLIKNKDVILLNEHMLGLIVNNKIYNMHFKTR